MMKITLKEVAEAKGYKNARKLTDAMSEFFGVKISYSTIYPLWDDTAQNFSRITVDRICTFLKIPLSLWIQHIDTGDVTRYGPAQVETHSKAARSSASVKQKRGPKQARAAIAIG
ncbi:MAG: hypothetical protein ACLGJB_03060 [Blastocatellia bacterium]